MSDLIIFISVIHIMETPKCMRRILFLTNFSFPYFSSMGDGSLEKSLAHKSIFLISFPDFLISHYTTTSPLKYKGRNNEEAVGNMPPRRQWHFAYKFLDCYSKVPKENSLLLLLHISMENICTSSP